MADTVKQFDQITAQCRRVFVLKMKDYGPSWRIMRPQTVNDQLFIKAKRIREIETTGVNLVGDSIDGELMAIINYSVIGLIQLSEGYADCVDMTAERATELYDHYIAEAKALMLRKNHDYGEAWREMSKKGIVDMILAKIIRIKTILEHEGKTIASEGVEGNYFDIINYAIFDLIHYEQ